MENKLMLVVILACQCNSAEVLSPFPFEVDYDILDTLNDLRVGRASNFEHSEKALPSVSYFLSNSPAKTSANEFMTTQRPIDHMGARENPFAAWMNLPRTESVHVSSTSKPNAQSPVRERSTTSAPLVSNVNSGVGSLAGWGIFQGNNGSVVDVSSSNNDSVDCSAGSKATASTAKRSGSTVGVSATLCLTKDKLVISLTQAGSVGSKVLNSGASKSMEFSYANTFTMSLKLPEVSELLVPPAEQIVLVPKNSTGGSTL